MIVWLGDFGEKQNEKKLTNGKNEFSQCQMQAIKPCFHPIFFFFIPNTIFKWD